MKLAISVLVLVHLVAVLWHGDAHTHFIDSAALIAGIELVSALFGFFALGRSLAFRLNPQV